MRRAAARGRFGRRGWSAWLAAAGLALACGGEEPAAPADPAGSTGPRARQDAGGAENQPPAIVWARVNPRDPEPGSRVRAEVRAEDPDGDPVRLEYRWLVDGREVGRGQTHALEDLERGDVVELWTVATDGRTRSEEKRGRVTVANRVPRLVDVLLEAPDDLAPGEKVVASPQAVDADGDELRFEYTWRVNGEEVPGDGPVLETDGLSRGDAIDVAVVASDGYDESEERTSEAIRVGNAPPQILSQPTWEREGDTFRYQVEARDPDGDRTLRYRLREAPAGMRVDAIAGVVTWTPQESQTGTHAVELEVDDLNGGRSVQRFEVVMDLEAPEPQASQEPAAPAPVY